MTKLKKIITVTALSSLLTIGLSSKAESTTIFRGLWPGLSCGSNAHSSCSVDPPSGSFVKGRLTLEFDRNRLFINEFGWFGELSNEPQIPPPDIVEGPFISSEVDLKSQFLPPNPDLETEACLLLLNEATGEREDFTFDRNGEISGEPCGFDITEPLILPSDEFSDTELLLLSNNEVTEILDPQPEDDIFAINFEAISPDGLQINSTENFNFFGFTYELTEEDDDKVGLRAVPLGTGDFGLFPSASFNTIICSPASGNGSLGTCGQEDPPSDFTFITKSVLEEDSNNPGFVCDDNTNRGFFSNGDPFQLLNHPCPNKINEPQNSFGIIALGALGTHLALKRKKTLKIAKNADKDYFNSPN